MAYYRFTRLQQYINGQPTDVYSKGERVDDVDYSTYDDCMGGTADTRWVSMPQTVCYNGDLWSMEKEEISYDGGTTWSDTGNTRRASVIEPSASQCTGADNDWRPVPNEYVCDGTSKCIKEAEYINNSPTGRTRAGSIVELLSGDCGVMYQWVDVPGEYVCVYKCGRADKYTKQKQQYSIDGGLHWEDTGETREGNFIEKNSADCGCDTSITRWVAVSGEYVCVGTSKYTKEKEQTSTDAINWTDTGETRAGSLIETESDYCLYCHPTNVSPSCNGQIYNSAPVTSYENISVVNLNYDELAFVPDDGVYGFNGTNGTLTRLYDAWTTPSSNYLSTNNLYISNNYIYTTVSTTTSLKFVRKEFNGGETYVNSDLTFDNYIQKNIYPINNTSYILIWCDNGRDLRTITFKIYKCDVNFDAGTVTNNLIHTITLEGDRVGWVSTYMAGTNNIYISISNGYWFSVYQVNLNNYLVSEYLKCKTNVYTKTYYYKGSINRTSTVWVSYPTNTGWTSYNLDTNEIGGKTYLYELDCHNGHIWYYPCYNA